MKFSFLCLVAFIFVAGGLSACKPRHYVQASNAMEPSIPQGADLRLERIPYWFGSLRRWDVVLFKPPSNYEGLWAFRVVGLPGESINFESGGITIDGQRLDVPSSLAKLKFTGEPTWAATKQSYPVRVPLGSYFLLGDNSETANDSRMLGAIKRSEIVGRLVPEPFKD